jgi:hypothetical protein
LDQAHTILVGKITRIQVDTTEGTVEYGQASIAVQQTLKGAEARTMECRLATAVVMPAAAATTRPDEIASAMFLLLRTQCHTPQTYDVGNEGIWLFPGAYGQPEMLPLERLAEIKARLDALKARTWSRPVFGLRVWGGTCQCDDGRERIIFAVQNVLEDEPLLCPRGSDTGVLTVITTAADGRIYRSDAAGDAKPRKTVATCRLDHGRTEYLEPTWGFCREREGDLEPGEYSMVITIANDRPGSGRTENTTPKTWQGSVSCPPFRYTIRPPTTQPTRSTQVTTFRVRYEDHR